MNYRVRAHSQHPFPVIPGMFLFHLCNLPAAALCVSWTGCTRALWEYQRTGYIVHLSNDALFVVYIYSESHAAIISWRINLKRVYKKPPPTIIQYLLKEKRGALILPSCTGWQAVRHWKNSIKTCSNANFLSLHKEIKQKLIILSCDLDILVMREVQPIIKRAFSYNSLCRNILKQYDVFFHLMPWGLCVNAIVAHRHRKRM